MNTKSETDISSQDFVEWMTRNNLKVTEAKDILGYTTTSAIYQFRLGHRRVPPRTQKLMKVIDNLGVESVL